MLLVALDGIVIKGLEALLESSVEKVRQGNELLNSGVSAVCGTGTRVPILNINSVASLYLPLSPQRE